MVVGVIILIAISMSNVELGVFVRPVRGDR